MTSPRAAMVAAAANLIARNGVRGTSIGDVLAASDAPRGSVYHHFPGGRRELLLAAVGRGAEPVDHVIAATARMSPGEVITELSALWARVLVESDFAAGSSTALAASVRTDQPDVAELAAQRYRQWTDHLAMRLRTAGHDADAAHRLAVLTLASVEGAIVLCQASRSLEPLAAVTTSLLALVGSTRAPGAQ